ncbi:hypothetical protein [Polymorphobacter megasporae]|nr:hypothetical protein [Polymorphobacter megasporae]UAJ10203.1 hypothetical protein KTC28_00025 [Polymorphobacter megasporae]
MSTILKGGWRRMIEQRVPAAVARVSNGDYRPAPDAPDARCHTDDP